MFDRDNTLIEDSGYTHRLSDLSILDGIESLLNLANENNVSVAVISNQSGVARGYFSEEELTFFSDSLWKKLSLSGLPGIVFFYCIHHPNEGCACRKPSPVMLNKCMNFFGVDRANSSFFGDSQIDLQAGHSADVFTRIGSNTEIIEHASKWILKEC
jgi:D-glycero-D-manno-heptose 1,7-bisphosphate phosphatase